MSQRKSKKQTKRLEKSMKKKQSRHSSQLLPVYGSILVGKTTVSVPYVDQIENLVSTETDKQPVKPKRKGEKGTRIIAKILRFSGLEPLVDIGEAMIH